MGLFRIEANKMWVDNKLNNWIKTDEILGQHFAHFYSFVKVYVINNVYQYNRTTYGFVSFMDSFDFCMALKKMNNSFIINRPCKLCFLKWYKKSKNNQLTSFFSKKNWIIIIKRNCHFDCFICENYDVFNSM